MIAKQPLINSGSALIDLAAIVDFGWGTAAGQNAQKVDLTDNEAGSAPAAVALIARTTKGQGDTPTAPGAAKVWRVQYAFSDNVIALADAPAVLANRVANLDCSLPNTDTADVRENASARVAVTGRYLYVWWFQTGWDSADAKIHGEVWVKALT